MKAIGDSVGVLRHDAAAALFLSALLSPPLELRAALLRAAPATGHAWNSSDAHGDGDITAGEVGPPDAAAYFVLASCRAWPLLTPGEDLLLRPRFNDALAVVRRRVTSDGFYVLERDSGATVPHMARLVPQAQAVAALRCASVVLDDPSLAADAAVLLRRLHSLFVPPGGSGGNGPFLPAVELDPEAGGGVTARPPRRPMLSPGPALASLLLWLEPGDLPDAVVARVAASLVELDSPAGIGDWNGDTWRVAPVDQAIAVLGAGKHLAAMVAAAARAFAEALHRVSTPERAAAAADARRAEADGRAAAAAARRRRRGDDDAAGEGDDEGGDEGGGGGGDEDEEGRAYGPEDGEAGAEDGYGAAGELEEGAYDDGERGGYDAENAEDEGDDAAPADDGEGEDAVDAAVASEVARRIAAAASGEDGRVVTSLLRNIIEVASRVAPLLEQCEAESAARGLARDLTAAVAKGLPGRTAADCLDAYIELNRCPVARFSGSGTPLLGKAPRRNSLTGGAMPAGTPSARGAR